jgi:predicted RNase H-like HicB family nuclease
METKAYNSGHNRSNITSMIYRVALQSSEEGFAVSCPGLPGCWSQGATEQEALENIRDAIREYLEAVTELTRGKDIREVEVAVG